MWITFIFFLPLCFGNYVREFGTVKSNHYTDLAYNKPLDIHQRFAENETTTQEENMPPLWMLQQLDELQDPERFLLDFVEDGQNFTTETVLLVGPQLVFSKDGDQAEERKASVQLVESNAGPKFAEAAGCKPVPTVVPLYDTSNPRMIVYPRCTTVEQCQGCCNLPAHGCQPTKTENMDVRVIKAMYRGNGERLEYLGKYTVRLQRHLDCFCSCKIKAEDCNQWHQHNPYTCKCDCLDKQARGKCMAEDKKIWDEMACMCICKESRICSSGLYFDHDLCRCRPMDTLEMFHSKTNNQFRHAKLQNDFYNITSENETTTENSTTSTTSTSTTTPTTILTTTPTPAPVRRKNRREFLRKLRNLKNRSRNKRRRTRISN